MTCCPVGRHAQADAIDRAIRAQQAASQANASTTAPSYSQIARTYGVRKATLFAHRDECLANRYGVPVRSDGVPQRTAGSADDGNASGSAQVDRYAATGPARDVEGVDGRTGRATGPPSDGTNRRNTSRRRVPDVAQIGAVPAQSVPRDRDTDVVVAGAASSSDGSDGAAPFPPRRPRPHDARARERSPRAAHRWDVVGMNSVDVAAERITHAINDSELHDPNSPRAHATYVQEIIEIVDRMEWNNAMTVDRLARAWDKPKMFVLGCYRDACTLMRLARGSPNEDREVSLRLWHNLFMTALEKGDPISLKVAADARKGYDAAAGIVDKSTRVQVNIAQSDEARAFVAIFLDEAKGDPALLERIRRRLAEARDRLGDTTAILATADAAE